MNYSLKHPRSLSASQNILRRAGVTDSSGLGLDDAGEDRLGVSLEDHRRWMRETNARELRAWAEEWLKG